VTGGRASVHGTVPVQGNATDHGAMERGTSSWTWIWSETGTEIGRAKGIEIESERANESGIVATVIGTRIAHV
jgi:hypothetical protein